MLSGDGNENVMCSTLLGTYLCLCFARLQRETSRHFLVTRFMKDWCSHFLTAAIKLSRFSSNEIGLICFFFLFFISRSSSFFVIHFTSMLTLKFSRKKESALLLLYFFSLKVWVAMQFTAETRGCLKCKISPRLSWTGGRTYASYGRFSQNQNFLNA